MFILHKAKILSAQIKAKKFGSRAMRAHITYGTPELASHKNRMCMQVSCGDVTGADSGGPVWSKVYGLFFIGPIIYEMVKKKRLDVC